MSATQRLPDGALIAQRDAPVVGQAVLEGVMMRGVSTWAVAVRKPLPEEVSEDGVDPERGAHGEIEVTSFPLTSILKKHRLLRLPIVRGVVALGDECPVGQALRGGHCRSYERAPRLAARRLKRSTRPPVSTSFWRPV